MVIETQARHKIFLMSMSPLLFGVTLEIVRVTNVLKGFGIPRQRVSAVEVRK